MNRPEKVIYTAKVHTTGGRVGASRSDDGRLEVKLSRPGRRRRHQPRAAVRGRLVRLLRVVDGSGGAPNEDRATGRSGG